MILRYMVAGLNIVVIASILIAYGVVTGSQPIIGMGASTAVIGVVLIFTSASTSESLLLSLKEYSLASTVAITSILQDADMLGVRPCYMRGSGGEEYVVFSKSAPLAIHKPGVGYADTPYIAFPISSVLADYDKLSTADLRSALCSNRGLCNNIALSEEEGSVRVVLFNLPPEFADLLKYPYNPLVGYVLAAVGRLKDRVVCLERVSLAGGNAEVFLRVG
ncbi:hypothetical protein [Thermogladius sp.]|uniref:hypothetical protein n=1 Tax=Thermogladius sp. TaxID=2023064 RepID=UPI003D0F9145